MKRPTISKKNRNVRLLSKEEMMSTDGGWLWLFTGMTREGWKILLGDTSGGSCSNCGSSDHWMCG